MKLLVVEDEPKLARSLLGSLERAGYTVDFAFDGEATLDHDPSRDRRTGGAGIGLAIVARIVELHRGRVSVESDPGKGSTFLVQLPLSRT